MYIFIDIQFQKILKLSFYLNLFVLAIGHKAINYISFTNYIASINNLREKKLTCMILILVTAGHK